MKFDYNAEEEGHLQEIQRKLKPVHKDKWPKIAMAWMQESRELFLENLDNISETIMNLMDKCSEVIPLTHSANRREK